MVNVITVLVALGLISTTVWLLLRLRRRHIGFSGTVSQQWLMHHQGDDRS
jgi:hypothetical protein